MAVWLGKYRWCFLSAAILFLTISLYKSIKNWRRITPFNKGLVYITTILCVGLICYSILTTH